jgi:hypothetical protein
VLIHNVPILLGTHGKKQAQKTRFEEFCLTPLPTPGLEDSPCGCHFIHCH